MASNSNGRLNRRTLVGAAGAVPAMAAAATMVSDASAAPASAPARNQSLAQDANLPTPREQTVVIEQSIINVWDSFNPFIPNGEAYQYGYGQLCRESMFYANFLTGEIKPWLAEEYSYNEDFTQCTLKLKPNVT